LDESGVFMVRRGSWQPGYVRERVGPRGVRFQALYLVDGKYIAAGSFDTLEEAEAAWQERAQSLRVGTHADPRKGRTPFKDFVPIWESSVSGPKARTMVNYAGTIRKHLLPTFGELQLMEITPEHVARWVRKLKDEGKAASTIATYRGQLSGILAYAVTLRYVVINPCIGVKTPPKPPRRIRAITPDDAGLLIKALPGPATKMLVEVDLQSGCRWGEITELRGRDVRVSRGRCYLDLTRAVSDVGAEGNPLKDGGRFYIEDTTKGGHDRKVGLSRVMTDKLLGLIDDLGVGEDDLVFPLSRIIGELNEAERRSIDTEAEAEVEVELVPEDLGRTDPNAVGRTYRHGTMTAYSLGKCRCRWCRRSYSAYRADRRTKGFDRKDSVELKTGKNLTDHLPRDWFRRNIWLPALETAGFAGRKVVFHDLRHSHATWLARSHSVDIETLRVRMGHRSILTTQLYISAAEEIDTDAADVMEGLMS
jgi:integrase